MSLKDTSGRAFVPARGVWPCGCRKVADWNGRWMVEQSCAQHRKGKRA